jgi:hypothetical protein
MAENLRAADLETRLLSVEGASQHRQVVEQTRAQGKRPVSIVARGTKRHFSAATATIAPGASEIIYLTYDGLVGGQRVFTRRPLAPILMQDEDDTPGGLPQAAGPFDPAKNMTLITPENAQVKLMWLAANGLYAVRITNDDVTSHCYVVDLEGF